MQIRSFSPNQQLRQPQRAAASETQSGPQDGYTASGGDFKGPRVAAGLVGVAAATGIGYGLGSAASMGGFAGAVVGGITGLVTTAIIAAPMGNGKGGEGLIYPLGGAVVGLVGGAVVGAFGGNAATITGTVLGAGTGLTLAKGALFG